MSVSPVTNKVVQEHWGVLVLTLILVGRRKWRLNCTLQGSWCVLTWLHRLPLPLLGASVSLDLTGRKNRQRHTENMCAHQMKTQNINKRSTDSPSTSRAFHRCSDKLDRLQSGVSRWRTSSRRISSTDSLQSLWCNSRSLTGEAATKHHTSIYF